MRWHKGLVALGFVTVVFTACGDTGDAAPSVTTTTTTATVGSTANAPPTVTTVAATTTVVTTQPPVATVAEPANADAAFSLTHVAFGEGAYIQITNTGNGRGELEGHWLCQRPVYFEIPAVELGPGESVWVAADGADLRFVGAIVGVVDAKGRIGSLVADTGEVALYRDNDFGNPDSMVDYVEWGSTGHGRSSVAVTAGQWPEAGFVVIPGNTIGITAPGGGDAPAAWAPDIGV